MTNESARDFFKEKGLDYSKLNKSSIYLLLAELSDNLESYCRDDFKMRVSHLREKDMKFDENGKLIKAFIRVDSHYFKGREAISFNAEGFIGFCGWASSGNADPVLKCFTNWVNKIVERA